MITENQTNHPFLLNFEYRKDIPVPIGFDSHDNYEIFYFHQGEGYYLIGDAILPLQPGSLLIMHGLTLHSPCTLEEIDYVRTLINFDPTVAQPVAKQVGVPYNLFRSFERIGNGMVVLQRNERAEFEGILERMHRFKQESGMLGYFRFLLAFIDLLLLVDAYFSEKVQNQTKIELASEKVRLVQKVISYLEQLYMEHLTLERIGKSLHINKFYLSRAFKEITGMTIFQYLYRKRINAAKMKLITNQAASIMEIAMQSGFINVSHFCKMFKVLTGHTPVRYRNMMVEGNYQSSLKEISGNGGSYT